MKEIQASFKGLWKEALRQLRLSLIINLWSPLFQFFMCDSKWHNNCVPYALETKVHLIVLNTDSFYKGSFSPTDWEGVLLLQ